MICVFWGFEKVFSPLNEHRVFSLGVSLSLYKNVMKKVLVLMSTFNGEKYLEEQLNSIFNQDGVFVSLLVRDDGSGDKTLKILREYSSNKHNLRIIEGENIGFAKSFMSLVYEAYNYPEFDYYAFSDQDDVWFPDKLASATRFLEETQTANNEFKPRLYFSNATATDAFLSPLFNTSGPDLTFSKQTSLVRYFMLGCTMVFNRHLVSILYNYRPEKPILMHDLWLNQTCAFLGEIVYDKDSHIYYRQHGNNTAGAGMSFYQRIGRLFKSFKTYERRHFRELNAKNLLSAYGPMLSHDDFQLISIVANYRTSIKSWLRFLLNTEINMGSFLSDVIIKIRIIFCIV